MNISNNNRIRPNSHLVHKWTRSIWLNGWVFVYELSGFGFESCCCYLNFRHRTCFKHIISWHSGNYRVRIHSGTRVWYDNNIQFFNAIVRRLIVLKTLKSHKCLGFCLLKAHQGSASDTKLHLRSLRNCIFPYKTQSSFTKWTLVKKC